MLKFRNWGPNARTISSAPFCSLSRSPAVNFQISGQADPLLRYPAWINQYSLRKRGKPPESRTETSVSNKAHFLLSVLFATEENVEMAVQLQSSDAGQALAARSKCRRRMNGTILM